MSVTTSSPKATPLDDLVTGHEFSMQLVPELADNLWLDGRIWIRAVLSETNVGLEDAR